MEVLRSNELVPEIRPQKEGDRDETRSDAGEPELGFGKKGDGLTLVLIQSTWWTPLQKPCETSWISWKRRRAHGCEGVARLELTERAGRAARLRVCLGLAE